MEETIRRHPSLVVRDQLQVPSHNVEGHILNPYGVGLLSMLRNIMPRIYRASLSRISISAYLSLFRQMPFCAQFLIEMINLLN